MRVFILAAGTGSRLYPLTREMPKSLLDIGGGSCLLATQLKAIEEIADASEVVVITGYRSSQVERWLESNASGLRHRVIYNPFFDTTNNLVSLWCARHLMAEDDFIVTNGDNLYLPGALSTALAGALAEGITLTASNKAIYDDDDMKLELHADGRVKRVGKQLPANVVGAESIGLAFVRGRESRCLVVEAIDQLVRDSRSLGRFWLEIFNRLSSRDADIHLTWIAAEQWAEVDFHPDIDLVRRRIATELRDYLNIA